MYYPPFEEIQHLRDTEMASTEHKGRLLLPFYCDILADMETPVSAYCKTAQKPYSFLLESVTGGEHVARYSFIGIDPYLVMIHRDEKATLLHMPGVGDATSRTTEEITCHDPLAFIETELGQYHLVSSPNRSSDELPEFYGGAVGYLSYDSVARFERLPVARQNELDVPLAVFCFTETVLAFDHARHRVRIVTHMHLDAPDPAVEYQRCVAILDDVQTRLHQPIRLPEEPAPIHDAAALQVVSNRSQKEFEDMVRRSIEYIRAGDIFQVVPSQRLSRHVNAAPFTVYRALRAINPSPYMFYLDLDDFHIVGASPELQVRYEDNEVTIRPIAGTRPRGTDKQSDEQLARELQNDPKECAEHVMLIDLARNDVGRVSIPGTVQVSELMGIERYSHVMHLVSNVKGKLREDMTPFTAQRAGFPAGTVSGAPKIRAMEIITELEGEQRGVYAGAVGYFSHSGNQETAIALRTMVIKNGRAYIQAGCGVVADSDPAYEYQESLNKAKALLRALDEAELIARSSVGAPFTAPGETPRNSPTEGEDNMLLLIDNYDSFTYNLYQYLRELGAEVEVRRNDEVTLDEIQAMQPEQIVISPGPCTPNEAGLSCQIIETFGPRIPLLGVCLGHQSIGQVYGGRVIRAPEPMHGKTSLMYHQGQGVFQGLPDPFKANRYHSLIVERSTLPDVLEITSYTEDGLIMGLRHLQYPVEGVQFHPESIMTPMGKDLLRNFLQQTQRSRLERSMMQ